MSNYKIDKDIPIPKCRNDTKYPFDSLEVGDSFFVSCEHTSKTFINMQRYVSYANRKRKAEEKVNPGQNIVRFISRRVDEGIRVWRLK